MAGDDSGRYATGHGVRDPGLTAHLAAFLARTARTV